MTSPARSAPAPVPLAALTFDEVRARIAGIPRVRSRSRRRRWSRRPTSPGARGPPHLREARRPHRRRVRRQQAAQPRVPPRAHDGGAPETRHRRPRPAVELGAPDRRRLQQARPPDDAGARGRPAREVQGNLLVDYLLGAEMHFARDRVEQRRLLDQLAEGAGARRAAAHPERQPDVRRRLGARLYRDHDRGARAAPPPGTRPSCFYMSSSGKGQAGIELAAAVQGGFRCTA